LIGDSRQCGCTDTEASLVDPASTLITTQEARLIVGIDVHKQSHAMHPQSSSTSPVDGISISTSG
jgi:hypothetical protein